MFNSQVILNIGSAGSTFFCYEVRRVVCSVRYVVPEAVLGDCCEVCRAARSVRCVACRAVCSVLCGARGCV